MTLAADILARAYALAPDDLDHVARTLHGVLWAELARGLDFQPCDTGGGCQMLVAYTPWETRVEITDGEAGLPEDAQSFCLGVLTEDDQELYALQVRDGHVEWRGGELT